MTLLDTSAIFALASPRDAKHAAARDYLASLDVEGEDLLVHTYVLLESFALVHRRLGLATAAAMSRELAGLPLVVVDREMHDRGVAAMRRGAGGPSSLVDAVSFLVMDDRGIERAFAFDDDFVRAGFRLVE